MALIFAQTLQISKQLPKGSENKSFIFTLEQMKINV
jgi:hypothetical protein